MSDPETADAFRRYSKLGRAVLNPDLGPPWDRLREIERALRNLQLLAIINFMALLWVLCRLGAG